MISKSKKKVAYLLFSPALPLMLIGGVIPIWTPAQKQRLYRLF